ATGWSGAPGGGGRAGNGERGTGTGNCTAWAGAGRGGPFPVPRSPFPVPRSPFPAVPYPPVTTAAPAPREGQMLAGRSLAVRYLNFVKFPHTLFALPFALLGVVAASLRAPVTWRLVLL